MGWIHRPMPANFIEVWWFHFLYLNSTYYRFSRETMYKMKGLQNKHAYVMKLTQWKLPMVSSIYWLMTNLDSSTRTIQTTNFSEKQYIYFQVWTIHEKFQLIAYLLRLLWPLMLSWHYNEVNAPLLNWIPWLILTDSWHVEIWLICNSTFATWIWGHIYRTRLCIIPEEDNTSSCQWWCISWRKSTAQITL